jgi:NitT/TauT family transport system ATP-binding protein
MLSLQNVSLTYKSDKTHVPALCNINLGLQTGVTYSVIGPSGSGKTSLLMLMAGLLQPTQGTISFLGQPLLRPHQKMALIPQEYGLLPWKTVWDNAALGLTIRGCRNGELRERLLPILRDLGLDGLAGRYPSQISGGQKQRVALARALALEPELLLMDEPLSALDALTRESMQELVLEIWLQHRVTIVLVTHSIEEAVYLGQEIIVLSPGPGQIRAVIANPGMGVAGYRNDPSFHHKCTEVRAILEGNSRHDQIEDYPSGRVPGVQPRQDTKPARDPSAPSRPSGRWVGRPASFWYDAHPIGCPSGGWRGTVGRGTEVK